MKQTFLSVYYGITMTKLKKNICFILQVLSEPYIMSNK